MDYFNQFPQLPKRPQFDPQQFLSLVATLDKNSLVKLVQLAKAQGISENDIRAGLEIITKNR